MYWFIQNNVILINNKPPSIFKQNNDNFPFELLLNKLDLAKALTPPNVPFKYPIFEVIISNWEHERYP